MAVAAGWRSAVDKDVGATSATWNDRERLDAVEDWYRDMLMNFTADVDDPQFDTLHWPLIKVCTRRCNGQG